MNLEQCRYLISIAQWGSINKASETLMISHQALSKMVKKLEAEFDCEIFKRHEQGVALTSDGDKIVALAQRFLDEALLIKEGLARLERGDKPKVALKILTTMVPHYSFLPDIVEFLIKGYPRWNVEMYHKNRQDITKDLASDSDESVLAFLTKRGQTLSKPIPGVEQYVLCQDKTYLVTGKDYPLSAKHTVSLEELRGQKFAIYQYDDTFDMPIFQQLQQAGIPFEVIVRTDNLKLWENMLTTSPAIGLSTELLRQYRYFHVDETQLDFYDIENYPEADIIMLAKHITDQELLEQLMAKVTNK